MLYLTKTLKLRMQKIQTKYISQRSHPPVSDPPKSTGVALIYRRISRYDYESHRERGGSVASQMLLFAILYLFSYRIISYRILLRCRTLFRHHACNHNLNRLGNL